LRFTIPKASHSKLAGVAAVKPERNRGEDDAESEVMAEVPDAPRVMGGGGFLRLAEHRLEMSLHMEEEAAADSIWPDPTGGRDFPWLEVVHLSPMCK
jgi:hypothetical protein